MNEEELRNLMYTAQLDEIEGPFSIRYPRGNGVMVNWKTPFQKLEIGKGRKIKDGKDIAILSLGHPGNLVTEAITILEKEIKELNNKSNKTQTEQALLDSKKQELDRLLVEKNKSNTTKPSDKTILY